MRIDEAHRKMALKFIHYVVNHSDSNFLKTKIAMRFAPEMPLVQLETLKTTMYTWQFVYPMLISRGRLHDVLELGILAELAKSENRKFTKHDAENLRLWIPEMPSNSFAEEVSWLNRNFNKLRFVLKPLEKWQKPENSIRSGKYRLVK
jgi:hypothetical protein